jgi:hypothetical protein
MTDTSFRWRLELRDRNGILGFVETHFFGGVQSNLLCQPKKLSIFGKEGMQGTTLSFPLVLESYKSLLLPYLLSLSHRFCIR